VNGSIAVNIRDIPPPPAPALSRTLSVGKLIRGVAQAVQSLWLRKLRTLLSVLGIVIGTSAVIALMAFGEGSMQDALDDIKKQGATNIIVRSEKPSDDSATASKSFVAVYGLKFTDLERFSTFGDAIVRMVPMRVFRSEISFGNRVFNGSLVATTPDYAEVNKLVMARGRFLADDENDNRINTCVLGAAVADKLFPFGDALDKTIDVRSFKYKVVGVVSDRQSSGGSGGTSAGENFNSYVYVTFKTGDARVGSRVFTRSAGSRGGEQVEITQVTITLSDVDKVRPIGREIRRMLEQHHDRKDWDLVVPLDKLEEAERTKSRFTILLAIIACISLLVGGIGIMNIMLATVTERTREIGIRRALGGKRGDIISQFLIEATVQTTIGGLMGVLVGLAAVYGLPPLWNSLIGIIPFIEMPLVAKLHVPAIFFSLGVSIGIGIFFGLFPAIRAARMDPIEALRHT
jgi:putative ABC transport system permease protein